MTITGTFEIKGTDEKFYYVSISEQKALTRYLVFSRYSLEDQVRMIDGESMLDGPLTARILNSPKNVKYLAAAAERKRVSGETKVFRNYDLVKEMVGAIGEAMAYAFSKEDVISPETAENRDGELRRSFSAEDKNLRLSYETVDGYYRELLIDNAKVRLDLGQRIKVRSVLGLPFQVATHKVTESFNAASIKDMSIELLREILDLSWYESEAKEPLKDYGVVETKEQFEAEVMEGLWDEYQKCLAEGKQLEIGLDTETTGLVFCDLSTANENRDRLVAIPISWKDDQARTIFVGMEFFENVPLDYALRRLKPFIEGEEKTTFRLPRVMGEGYYEYDRRFINVTGHNVLFDNKVFFSYGLKPWFDDDTLQMGFNLNPSEIKKDGGNKLKALTRKAFGHETPELSTILGKGKEAYYKYLRDKKVAEIYGCADADYSRLLRRFLRKMMPEKMFKNYRLYDIPLLNYLHESEYYGMTADRTLVEGFAATLESDLRKIREFTYAYVGQAAYYSEHMKILTLQKKIGLLGEDAFQQKCAELKAPENSRYEFEFKGADLRKVLYDTLGYPIQGYTSSETKPLPSVDKYSMEKLMSFKREEPSRDLAEDICSDVSGAALIKAKDFNSYKYPLAYVLSVYSDLNKDLVSYCNPILKENMENKLFKGYSLARIATRRIMNPGQTMKAKYKKAIIPYGEDYYMLDFDMSQVEYRIMLSLSGNTPMIELMKNPEKDYHTETASLVFNVPAYKVAKDLRKKAKTISFGLPYGLGTRSLCEKTHGGVVTDETMYDTYIMLNTFKERNSPIINLLEDFRDTALKEYDLDEKTKEFLGFQADAIVGKISNLRGFYRLFDLSNLDNASRASIRREAGNFPIQSLAAEFFRLILLRFLAACRREGIADKVIWHMLIHDELLCSVHKSVNPVLVAKIVKEACMITFPGHTKYFIGINFGYSWKECKDDKNELPVYMVEEISKRWARGELREYDKSDPVKLIRHLKDDYILRRIGEVVREIQPSCADQPLDVRAIYEGFTNYTVRSYVGDFFESWDPSQNPKSPDFQYWVFLGWAAQYFGEDKEVKWIDGKVKTIAS